MRRAIDAQRQATGDAEAGRGQAVGEAPGIVQSLGAGLATADQGQLRPLEQLDLAFDEQQGGWIGDLGEQRRIALVAQAEQVAFGAVQPGQAWSTRSRVAGLRRASAATAGRRRARQAEAGALRAALALPKASSNRR